VGRLANVTGSGYNNASQFASAFQYRAWGAPKHYNIGFEWWNGTSTLTPTDFSYNSRLQLTHFELAHPTSGASSIYSSSYQYYADGRLKFVSDMRAWSIQEGWPPTENMHQFDRGYSYDHAERLTQGLTGDEARGGSNPDGPYKETYQYDVWDHMTNRVDRIWSRPVDSLDTTYVNNRNQLWYYTYDADGNPTSDGSFDASGRKSSYGTSRFYIPFGSFNPNPTWNSAVDTNTYDGDGLLVKQLEAIGTDHFDSYWIRSTVLGGAVILWTEVATNSYYAPGWSNTIRLSSIYAAGDKIAHSTDGNVTFDHAEPLTGRRSGVEADPLGQEVGSYDPGPDDPGGVGEYPERHEYGNAEDMNLGCTADGITVDCNTAMRLLTAGAAGLAPSNSNRAVADPNNPGQRMLVPNLPIFGDFNLGRYQIWKDDGRRVDTQSPLQSVGSVMGTDEDGNPVEMDVLQTNRGEIPGHWEFIELASFQEPLPRKTPTPPPTPKYSKACLQALAQARQNTSGVDRARGAMDLLKKVAGKYGFDPALLAAIGVRESNFLNQRERNGGGRGVFQIDIIAHPALRAIAEDPSRLAEQADHAGRILAAGINKYSGYGPELAAAGGLREYNAGNRHNWSVHKFAGGRGGLDATVARLDRGTSPKKHGNYVSNVLAIARNCFH
jgi:hypothetical protein